MTTSLQKLFDESGSQREAQRGVDRIMIERFWNRAPAVSKERHELATVHAIR